MYFHESRPVPNVLLVLSEEFAIGPAGLASELGSLAPSNSLVRFILVSVLMLILRMESHCPCYL